MNEFTSPNTLQALLLFVAQSRSRLECGTSTVALEDVHQCSFQRARETNCDATKGGFPLNLPAAAPVCVHCGVPIRGLCVHCGVPICGVRRSKHRVLIFNAALAKTVRETNNGSICGCHHRSDAFYGGHGVFGRVHDVRGRFDEQDPEHTAHVDARGISGAHDIAAVRCHTIALTRLILRRSFDGNEVVRVRLAP